MISANLTYANLTGMTNWDQAFWMGATYNQNTIFPIGMDPEADCFGLIFIPAPATLALLSVAAFATRRRRSLSIETPTFPHIKQPPLRCVEGLTK